MQDFYKKLGQQAKNQENHDMTVRFGSQDFSDLAFFDTLACWRGAALGGHGAPSLPLHRVNAPLRSARSRGEVVLRVGPFVDAELRLRDGALASGAEK